MMIEIVWLTIVVLFLMTSFAMIGLMLYKPKENDSLKTILEGIKTSLKDCGFHFNKPKYKADVYSLELIEDADEDEICDDCLEMLESEPMDIADWLKEGFPQKPPPYSNCSGHCKCKLFLVNRSQKSKTHDL